MFFAATRVGVGEENRAKRKKKKADRKSSASLLLFTDLDPHCPDGRHQPGGSTDLPVRKLQPSPHLSPAPQQGPSLDVAEFESSAERWLLSSAPFSFPS